MTNFNFSFIFLLKSRCMNGGICIDGIDSFACSCPNKTSGVICECQESELGLTCEDLPDWFEYHPFQPNVGTDYDDITTPTSFDPSTRPSTNVSITTQDIFSIYIPTLDDSSISLYSTTVIEIAETPTYFITSSKSIDETFTSAFETTLLSHFDTISTKIYQTPVFSDILDTRSTEVYQTVSAKIDYSESMFDVRTSFDKGVSLEISPTLDLPSGLPSQYYTSTPILDSTYLKSVSFIPSDIDYTIPSVQATPVFSETYSTEPPVMQSYSLFPSSEVSSTEVDGLSSLYDFPPTSFTFSVEIDSSLSLDHLPSTSLYLDSVSIEPSVTVSYVPESTVIVFPTPTSITISNETETDLVSVSSMASSFTTDSTETEGTTPMVPGKNVTSYLDESNFTLTTPSSKEVYTPSYTTEVQISGNDSLFESTSMFLPSDSPSVLTTPSTGLPTLYPTTRSPHNVTLEDKFTTTLTSYPGIDITTDDSVTMKHEISSTPDPSLVTNISSVPSVVSF